MAAAQCRGPHSTLSACQNGVRVMKKIHIHNIIIACDCELPKDPFGDGFLCNIRNRKNPNDLSPIRPRQKVYLKPDITPVFFLWQTDKAFHGLLCLIFRKCAQHCIIPKKV